MEKKPTLGHVAPLSDSFGRGHNYLRLSLTDRCNLRCNYCMPRHPVFMPKSRLLTPDQIAVITETFKNLGIQKIRLTGGEPLVRPDFQEIVQRIALHKVPLHLTTNATLLHKHLDLLLAHFASVNISLDTLRADRFMDIAHRGKFQTTIDNIELAINSGLPVKVNMVVVRDVNHDEIPDFIRLTEKHDIEVRFIEFMPFKGNQWKFARSYSQDEMLLDIQRHFRFQKLPEKEHDTAQRFQVENAPGRFGFISTVSHPFCNSCNRLRITADGHIKNCLFSTGEFNLKPYLDDAQELEQAIRQVVMQKAERYGGNGAMHDQNNAGYQQNRTMTAIGG